MEVLNRQIPHALRREEQPSHKRSNFQPKIDFYHQEEIINPFPDLIHLKPAKPGRLIDVVGYRFGDVGVDAAGQNKRNAQPLRRRGRTATVSCLIRAMSPLPPPSVSELIPHQTNKHKQHLDHVGESD